MRIAWVVPGFSASAADWCVPALLDFASALAADHDLRIFALRYPHRRDEYDVNGARVTSLDGRQRRGLGRFMMWRRACGALEREGRRRPFDVIHALWAHEPAMVAARVARALRSPTVVSILGGELADLRAIGYGGERGAINRRLVAAALRNADVVTVGSRFLEEIARSRDRPGTEGGPREIVRLPLGVETRRFEPEGHREDLEGETRLLFVGSFVPVKAPRDLVRAFAAIARERPGLWLHLVGEGPERAACERLAVALGVEDRTRFHGAVRHERLPAFYRAADLCVLPSRFESQSLAVLEAAACGVVTVGTAVGVLPELLRADWLCPPGDPAQLARVVARALDADRESDSERSRARVLDDYSLERVLPRWLDLYRSVGLGCGEVEDEIP